MRLKLAVDVKLLVIDVQEGSGCVAAGELVYSVQDVYLGEVFDDDAVFSDAELAVVVEAGGVERSVLCLDDGVGGAAGELLDSDVFVRELDLFRPGYDGLFSCWEAELTVAVVTQSVYFTILGEHYSMATPTNYVLYLEIQIPHLPWDQDASRQRDW